MADRPHPFLQPFEKHPANPGELMAGADNLVGMGAEALQNEINTRQAYSPALSTVLGDPANAVARASDPVKAAAGVSSGSLVWAGVAVRYFGGQVDAFNRKVDEIVAFMEFVESGIRSSAENTAAEASAAGESISQADLKQIGDQRAANLAARRAEYLKAYADHIEPAQIKVVQLLNDGPTAANQQFARDVGAMPDLRYGPGERLLAAIEGRFDPPDDKRDPLFLSWLVGTFLTLGAAGSDGYRLANGAYISREQLDRMSYSDRFRAYGDLNSFTPKPGKAGGMLTANTFLDNVTRVGASLAAINGAINQYQRDEARPDLTDEERGARAATRSTLAGTGSLMGARAGIWAGQQTMAATKSPALSAVVTNGAVFVGGSLGSWAGNGIADWVIDD